MAMPVGKSPGTATGDARQRQLTGLVTRPPQDVPAFRDDVGVYSCLALAALITLITFFLLIWPCL